MAEVKGIGGVFFDSQDATRLAAWYEGVLGIELTAHPDGTGYYAVFATRDPETMALRSSPVFAINQAQDALARSGRGFMINLRVDNLDGYLEMLRRQGVEIEEQIVEWELGRHAWIRDPDGNRVELYEEILPAKGGIVG